MFCNIYKNKRILVTGHTGFKGSWLSLWLDSLGAQVTGVGLAPKIAPSHWDLLSLKVKSLELDIRDAAGIKQTISNENPEIVFHLAAQPLVRRSYRDPLDTWSTNVMGTANILDACREHSSVRAIVVITTDKCYENVEWVWGYRETDRLGGHDPYSASKAGAELVVSSFRAAFFQRQTSTLIATARAGNVIGGGDFSEDRLIPDLVRAIQAAESVEIRSPNATRPWQHVLDCLSGYLVLGKKLLERDTTSASAWNFGPNERDNREVQEVLKKFQGKCPSLDWFTSQEDQLHEANLLHLDSSKARKGFSWHPVWSFEEAVNATAEWYKAWLNDGNVISSQQLNDYIEVAKEKKITWTDL